MDRTTGWHATWTGLRRRAAGLPQVSPAAGALLGLLGVLASLAEFVAVHGSIPRMFAQVHDGSGAGPGTFQPGGVSGVQFGMVVGLVCLCTALPLALLRPLAAGVTVTAAGAGSLLIFQTLTVAGLAAQLVAQYRLGRAGAVRAALLLGTPFLALALAASDGTDYRARVVLAAVLGPMAALAGLAVRSDDQQRSNAAIRQVMDGTRWENAARDERARIVRELHDVVGHHVSMIAVQAETARLATAGMPAEGAERLLGIGDTARAAMNEMRRLLGVLREDTRASGLAAGRTTDQGAGTAPSTRTSGVSGSRTDPGAGPGTAPDRRPQPDLRQLNELLDEARRASGTSVRLILSGSPLDLDPGVEIAAYRIVQESLTNARKHAAGAAVDVELHYTADALHLRIRDNGPGSPPDQLPGGHGLLGMRERVAAVGGEVSTGPAPGGGFLVAARFGSGRDQGGHRGRRDEREELR
ncbi:sensor histidine kinase [Streptomyces sp. CA-111067]|uniref:sensor histidine kinase n=1 Tax=Streptomyces sp. CA-111067 TaxID=3240046 RepID=UPI003D9516A7